MSNVLAFEGTKRILAECQSLYMAPGGCCHSCVHDADHEERHLCACGYTWETSEAEPVN